VGFFVYPYESNSFEFIRINKKANSPQG